MMKSKYIYLLVGLFFFNQLASQVLPDSGLDKITPPSPKASTFHIYGNIPVSLNTGTPDISIPLYTIETGEISIPIVLKYHIGSLKLGNDDFSNVGWGWVLDYGGRISRTVYDNPDEVMENSLDVRVSDVIDEGIEEDFNYLRAAHTFLNKSLGIDTEHDIFSLASLGNYGDFLINKEEGIWSSHLLQINSGKIDVALVDGIQFSNQIIESIKYTDGLGNQFYFGEGKVEHVGTKFGNECPSSWLLSEIVSSYGKSLAVYEYADIPEIVYRPINNAYVSVGNDWIIDSGYAAVDCNYTGSSVDIIEKRNTLSDDPPVSVRMKTINKITFPSGTVEFELMDDNRHIKNFKTKDLYGNTVKWVEFIYSNFGTINRTKLTKVVVKDSQGNEIQNYQFKYNIEETTATGYILTDTWGNFKGFTNNSNANPRRSIKVAPSENNHILQDILIASDGSDLNAGTSSYGFALNKIIYPTKGATKFTYELNQYDRVERENSFENLNNSVLGAGFRVAKIEDLDEFGQTVGSRMFQYDPGIINFDYEDERNYVTTVFNLVNPNTASACNQNYFRTRDRVYHRSLVGELSFDNVHYDKVTEVFVGFQNEDNGKIVYHYNYPYKDIHIPRTVAWTTSANPLRVLFNPDNNGQYIDNHVIYKRRNFGGAQLGKVEYYNASESGYYNDTGLMKVVDYKYSQSETESFDNLRIHALTTYSDVSGEFGPIGTYALSLFIKENMNDIWLPVFIHHNYTISCGRYYRSEKTTTTYNSDGDSHEVKESFVRDALSQLKETNITDSYGESITTKNHYIYDAIPYYIPDNELYNSMISKNIIENVVASDRIVDGNVTESKLIKYDVFGNSVLAPKEILSKKGTNAFESRGLFYSYDTHSNPIEMSMADSPHVYYIWGYNGQYPIAKIENFDNDDALSLQPYIIIVENASNLDDDRTIDNYDENGDRTYLGKEGDLREALESMRVALPEKSIMISYTYDPLIGVTSHTDSKGYTMYYEYDDFSRVIAVKDTKGNILEDYKYHYNPQN